MIEGLFRIVKKGINNMMKFTSRLFLGFLAAIMLSIQCFAASGNVGYAVYRDGVDVLSVHEWHAAIINGRSKTSSQVIHAKNMTLMMVTETISFTGSAIHPLITPLRGYIALKTVLRHLNAMGW